MKKFVIALYIYALSATVAIGVLFSFYTNSQEIVNQSNKDLTCAYNMVCWADQEVSTLQESLGDITSEYMALKEKYMAETTVKVTVSFYHPNSGGINTDGDPSKTALMVKPIAGKTVAVSSELFELGWLGKSIYIEGIGVMKADDRMGKSIKGLCIDVCVGSYKEAMRLGKRFNVKAVRL